MKSILVLSAVLGAIAAFTIPQSYNLRKEIATGIVNGTNASISDFKYLGSVHVSIIGDLTILSGTAIILANNWVLTSAASVFNVTSKDLTVRVGSSDGYSGGQLLNVSETFLNPRFNVSAANVTAIECNVALLKLKENITFNEVVVPVVLTAVLPEVNSTATVAGFGLTANWTDPLRLRSINVTVIDYQVISEKSPDRNVTLIKTNSKTGGGPTLLDWGSPLVIDGEVFGIYIGDVNVSLPSQRNSSTIDSFVDLTSEDIFSWIIDTVEKHND